MDARKTFSKVVVEGSFLRLPSSHTRRLRKNGRIGLCAAGLTISTSILSPELGLEPAPRVRSQECFGTALTIGCADEETLFMPKPTGAPDFGPSEPAQPAASPRP